MTAEQDNDPDLIKGDPAVYWRRMTEWLKTMPVPDETLEASKPELPTSNQCDECDRLRADIESLKRYTGVYSSGWRSAIARPAAALGDQTRCVGAAHETPRYDDKRDIQSVIDHLRFGDSDGDDHDIAAAELERLLAPETKCDECELLRHALRLARRELDQAAPVAIRELIDKRLAEKATGDDRATQGNLSVPGHAQKTNDSLEQPHADTFVDSIATDGTAPPRPAARPCIKGRDWCAGPDRADRTAYWCYSCECLQKSEGGDV